MTENFDKLKYLNESDRKMMGLPEQTAHDFNVPSSVERKVSSPEEVAENIKNQIAEIKSAGLKNDIPSLEARRNDLAEKPIMGDKYFFHASYGLPSEGKFVWAQTDKIIGRPFAENYLEGWAHEYDNRQGRLAEIAAKLSKEDMDTNDTEYIFHAAANQAEERIKLLAADGPAGPIYMVEDGTHRIGASKLAALKEIPAEVRHSQYPLKIMIENLDEKNDWQIKIDHGIIQGHIEVEKVKGETAEFLVIEKELVSWARETNPNRFTYTNRQYEKLYPGSMDNLSIPRQAMTDPVAYNYFMAGRFEEWQKSN